MVVQAIDRTRLLPGLRQSRQKHRRQDGYDGYNDQQLYERELFATFNHLTNTPLQVIEKDYFVEK